MPHSISLPFKCSACVYKALFRGEVVAAKEVDLGRSPAVQAAFLTVGCMHCALEAAVHLHGVALLTWLQFTTECIAQLRAAGGAQGRLVGAAFSAARASVCRR